jgi:adenosylcobinamide-GDP ribazoletransferase
MKTILKSFIIAFSTYSKIPMPQFEWRREDMKYALCFFPWVGAVVGGVLWLFCLAAERLGMGELSTCLIGTAIPLAVTGGFHLDGFLDAMDAFHSYGERERKLEILKDAHIGAFSVIMTLLCGMIYVSAFSEIQTAQSLAVFCCGFVLSRTLSGLSLVYLKAAKSDGLLVTFAGSADVRIVRVVLWLELFLCSGVMLGLSPVTGGIVLCAAVFCFGYYRRRSYRELGGITGDMAGYFVVICETAMAVAAAVGSRI